MSRAAVVAAVLALGLLAATCDYRADPPIVLNETGEELEAHLLNEIQGELVHAPTSPQGFTDELRLAASKGCAHHRELELRRPGEDEVLLRHDLREEPICEFDVWVYRGGDELVMIEDGTRDRQRGW